LLVSCSSCCYQLPKLPHEIESLYQDCNTKNTRLNQNELTTSLRSVVSLFSHVYIVIDALDEVTGDGTRRTLLKEVSQLPTNTSLLGTSRYISDIEMYFKDVTKLEILATDEDIRRYLVAQIRQDENLARHCAKASDLETTITTVLVNQAKGMFLGAQLNIQALAKKVTVREVRKALAHLPQDIFSQYDDSIQRIRSQGIERAKTAMNTLLWITQARRPLTIAELQCAIASLDLELGDETLDEAEYYTDHTVILAVCAGLIVLDEQTNVVRLVHYTADEYFKDRQAVLFADQYKIPRACLLYLLLDVFSSGPCSSYKETEARLSQSVFLDYASKEWDSHVRSYSDRRNGLVLTAFIEAGKNVLSARQAAQGWKWGYDTRLRKERDVRKIFTASRHGLNDVMDTLVDFDTSDIDVQDEFGKTPLFWAARNGHDSVVQVLLKRGADTQDKYWVSPLNVAVLYGYDAVVQLLLKHGAEMELDVGFGATFLHSAAMYGHGLVVAVLLKSGADIEARDDTSRQTSLHVAALYGHISVVHMLLRSGADAEAQDKFEKTPIYWAAQRGHESVVQILLKHGANVGTQDTEFENAPEHWDFMRYMDSLDETFYH
jgi:hypothetical protein